MSLRFRINLIITVLILVFSLVMAKIVLDDARRQIREEMEAGTKVTLQLLSAVGEAVSLVVQPLAVQLCR